MQESFYKTLGQKLKASRKMKGITLTELAEAVHRSPASLSKREIIIPVPAEIRDRYVSHTV